MIVYSPYRGPGFSALRCVVLAILTLLLLIPAAKAQSDDLNFISLSSKDGLSSNAVNAILKDRYGYMWFGTDDGLNKFDGENFTVYRHNDKDSTSVPANRIMALLEDRQGNLWIGTSEALCLYDRKRDAFISYDFLGTGFVRALCVDRTDNLWIGGYAGLFRFDPRTRSATHYQGEPSSPNHLISNTIVSLFADSRGRLWIGANEGLHLYDRNKNNFIRYLHSDADKSSISDNSIRTITEDIHGNLWFGTNDGGISQLKPNSQVFINYRFASNNNNSLNSNRVYALASDAEGKLWIGTEEGLNILDTRAGEIKRVVNDHRNKYGLNKRSIRSIYIDKNAVYWIGTFQAGISKYDKNLVFFNLRQSDPFDQFGLKAQIVTSFAEDANGDIYVGTDGGGLNHYHRKTGLFSHPRLVDTETDKSLSIITLERVGNELWIGTYGRGLYIYNTQTGVVRHFTKGDGPQGLLSNDIFCLKKDKSGNVWIGSNGFGINVFNFNTNTFYRLAKFPVPGDIRLPGNGFIRTIEEDNTGNVWIGTNGSGIIIYNPSNGEIKQLLRDNSDLPSHLIADIHKDRKGDIWIATLEGGLSKYIGDNKFISYSEKEGLSNSTLYKILESDTGKLWVSHNKGVSCFDKTNKKFKNYSHQNGLQKSTFFLGAGLQTADGELFFGGLDGFNFFDPRTFQPNKVVPSLVLTDLKISNRSVIPGPREAISEHISVAKEITLGHKQNFSLDFVALNYTAPQENRYSYKLEGFDKDWSHVETSKKAVYTNLDPGHYTFRLKASSDDGAWTSPETSIKIYVRPPFWRTTYAYVIYAVIFVGFLVLWRYWGIRRLKRKFAHEQEQLKIKFLTNLSHEFRTPISLIVGPVEKLMGQEASETKYRQLTMVKRNANRLLNLVNQLLDFRKLEANELTINLVEADMVAFVKDIADSFVDMSEAKDIKFTFSSTLDHLYTSFDKGKLERILFNLLSNAFKFTERNGEISLEIKPKSSAEVDIIIADTGVGMEAGAKEKIFDRFYQAGAKESVLNQGSGIGLSITREFVRMHGGTIQVESTPGKGSIFTVTLPCPPATAIPALPVSNVQQTPGTIITGTAKQPVEIPESDKLTILIVEDNDDFRSYLKENLEAYYKIIEAADGKEGWQKVLSSHPQIVVSDISMPYMDGIALCQKMKSDKRTSHIPVILLTALTGETNHLKGLRTGAVDYLTKPFNFEILNVKIKNLLGFNQQIKDTYSRHIRIDTAPVQVQSEDEKLMLQVAKYIEDNIDSPELSVEELSRHVFMSRGSLYSKIVTLTGETPVEFIRSFRLNKAAELLEHSDMRIAEIGYAVGFATPNYFTRAFKTKFGISPSDYCKLKAKHPGSNRTSSQSE